jgi:hypothetical protein
VVLASVELAAAVQPPPISRRLYEGAEIKVPDVAAVSDVIVDAAGGVIVLDRQPPFLHSVDARGHLARRFGVKGKGPGELSQPSRLGWRHDTLWVADPLENRVVVFTKRGTVVRMVSSSYRATYPFVAGVVVGLMTDGGLLLEAPTATSGNRDQEAYHAVVKVSESGSVSSVVGVLTRGNSSVTIPARINGQAGQMRARQPFSNDPIMAVDRQGTRIVIVDQRTSEEASLLRVLALSATGDTLFTRDVRYNRIRLDDRVFAEGLATLRDAPLPSTLKVEFNEAELPRLITRPRYLPAITEALVARDGTIWLRRSAVPGTSVAYLVLGRDGAAAETITLPKVERVVEAMGSRVWTQRVDDDGIVLIRVYSFGSRQ